MLIHLNEFENQAQAEAILKKISQMQVTELTLKGDFLSTTASQFLPLLPKTVKKVRFEYRPKYRSQLVDTGFSIYFTDYSELDVVGNFAEYVNALPEHIKKLTFHFVHEPHLPPLINFRGNNLIKTAQALRANVTGVDFAHFQLELEYGEKQQLFESLPATLREITFSWPDGLKFIHDGFESISLISASLFNQPKEKLIELFSHFSRKKSMRHLDLSKTQLHELPVDLIPVLFKQLPENLEYLNWSENKIWLNGAFFSKMLFKYLPRNLKVLNLSATGPCNLELEEFVLCLKEIPKSVIELDLSNNNIDLRSLSVILSALPVNIKRLKISEEDFNLPAADLCARFAFLPPHVTTLILSGKSLHGLSSIEIITALSRLTKTIKELDFSEGALSHLTVDELIEVISQLPPHVKKINLSGNQLHKLSPLDCDKFCSSFPKTLMEIDISDNGFSDFCPFEFERLKESIPATIKKIILDEGKFGFRQDGVLVPFSKNRNLSLFKPVSRLTQQKELARLRVVLMQWLNQVSYYLPDELLLIIFNAIFEFSKFKLDDLIADKQAIDEYSGIINQLSKTLIAATPPDVITDEVQQHSFTVAKQRIGALKPGAQHLDLGWCGLNRLEDRAYIQALFESCPKTISSLSLRNNGFQRDSRTLNRLYLMLSQIPEHIKIVDLSGHGFEQYGRIELEELFSHLPASVQGVSLTDEKPISPEHQIARRVWPHSYSNFIGSADLKKAYFILKDYTKQGSFFLRFVHMHWNRHYSEQISALVRKIECEVITTLPQLLFELEQMDIENMGGSLSRRLAFLSYAPSDVENLARRQEDAGYCYESLSC
ncbi:DUF5617 domain-containing protein [Legionella jordanis]|uniref:Leucine-rich repeat-containing protein (Substrate of the Dot/Icm secretion system) n=1 Tax=Legionella jordanis TaxID=456 RepID=A0A0W0V9P6_9GAMM|nr:DUF5617 domain-containing protein [Legionella jordanis]KTD16887.1 leucine-rich repeat-containing protein (substrate of the Dot/Icm secretion system) [Legionella jordanis]RMX00330.1 hypothetical protein EAW55_12950 [Legionella jordanis]RMX15511.1 hypothetical protein EAS68_12115 [Legionella jordanis]VEH13584.1 leucine-rich repeat-containing protein (substrate of the Dot/Icm secretion system) [Legionella jordanis]